MRFFLVAALSLTLTGVQDKTYDLKLDWKPVKGYRTALQETGDTRMTIQVAGQGVILSEAEQMALAAVETVVSADDAGGSERTWAFSGASKDKDGQKQPLAFAGRTVRNLAGQGQTAHVCPRGERRPRRGRSRCAEEGLHGGQRRCQGVRKAVRFGTVRATAPRQGRRVLESRFSRRLRAAFSTIPWPTRFSRPSRKRC